MLIYGGGRTFHRNSRTEIFNRRRGRRRTFILHNRIGGRNTGGAVIFRRIFSADAAAFQLPENGSKYLEIGRRPLRNFILRNSDGLFGDGVKCYGNFGRFQLPRNNFPLVQEFVNVPARRYLNGKCAADFQMPYAGVDGDRNNFPVYKMGSLFVGTYRIFLT